MTERSGEQAAEWPRLRLWSWIVFTPRSRSGLQSWVGRVIAWYGEEPRPGFTKATVSAWRVTLETRESRSVSITVRITPARNWPSKAPDTG